MHKVLRLPVPCVAHIVVLVVCWSFVRSTFMALSAIIIIIFNENDGHAYR